LTAPSGGRYPFLMRVRTYFLGLLASAALLASCAEEDLPSATVENAVETFTLGALWGTPVGTASAYRMFESDPIRTDKSSGYDFLYDVDSVLGPAFYPAEVTGVIPPSSANPGLMISTTPFDSIKTAKSNGYITDAPIAVDSGTVLYLRSLVTCGIGVPLYGKLEVMSIDSVARTLTFRVMVNQNCGYRDLQPGLPQD
jgi:hypothetical protein